MRLRELRELVENSQKEPQVSAQDSHYSQFLAPIDTTPPKEDKALAVVEDEESSESLDTLIKLSFKGLKKILKETLLDPNDSETYVQNAKLVLSAAQAVTSIQLKVDENKLKAKKTDAIRTILAELKADEAKALSVLELSAEPD